MRLSPTNHFRRTAKFAKQLSRKDVYDWLMTTGYYPEQYVLPPCFVVTRHKVYGKKYFKHTVNKFSPTLTQYKEIQFPKNELSDRAFGVISPEIHSDIAYTLARNWMSVLSCLFHKKNKVCSYSFPIPINVRTPGKIGGLRSGRLIYEFIEMAENDLASIAHGYKYLLKTDVKNCYPSIYTHSIPWALHGKRLIRKGTNRYKFSYVGNRLDKLMQNCNDGCTNGIPIGPAVSDLLSEIILAAVDTNLSKSLPDDVVVVRFKDDYRILAKTESDGRHVIKSLQSSLRSFKLEINESKTELHKLPDGLFRNWVSQYHSANPNPKHYYSFKRFKEVYLAVISIDRANPNTGVIDRFLSDITTRHYRLRIQLDNKSLPKVVSLLLMLGELRTKAFPKVLAIIEAILRTRFGAIHLKDITEHLETYMNQLVEKESENTYPLMWLCYFIRANNLPLTTTYKFQDPIVRSIYTSRNALFKKSNDFTLFSSVRKVSKNVSMLKYLDAFRHE